MAWQQGPEEFVNWAKSDGAGRRNGTATSGGNGNYSFTVPTGWQGVVKASGGGLTTWTPTFTYGVATPVITNLTDNFSGN